MGTLKIAGLLSLLAGSSVMFASGASAEVTSQPCPHSCATRGLDKAHCKDWSEGNACYVDDMSNAGNNNRAGSREIVMLNKQIRAGNSTEVDLPEIGNMTVSRFDVVVRREGSSTETQLGVILNGKHNLGLQQVDQNQNHVLGFSANGIAANRGELKLDAVQGDLFIESVHLIGN